MVQSLQARRKLGEVVVAEVGLSSAGSHDEGVVAEDGLLAAFDGGDGLRVGIDGFDGAAHHTHVLLVGKHLADVARDLTRGHQARRHLVQQRREKVVVGVVDQRDVDISVRELLHGVDAAETRADNHNVVAAASGAVHL